MNSVEEQLPPLRETVGFNIRLIRKHFEMTLEQLSLQFGHSIGSLSMIETGEVATTVDTIDKIALALGCSAQLLVMVDGHVHAIAQIERRYGGRRRKISAKR